MGTPPTLVSQGVDALGWDSTATPKTVSVSVQASDVLAVLGGTEDQSCTLSTPTGNSLVYTLQQSIEVANYCTDYAWTAPPAGSATFSVSCARSALASRFNISASVWRGSSGVGASAKTNVASGAPSLSITTTADNSAVVVLVLDWNAADGTTRTWRTVNGITPTAANGAEWVYFRNSVAYTVYAAYWSDAGVAGAKTVGLSAPSGQKYSIIAVEITGTAGSGTNAPAEATSGAAAAQDASVAVTAQPDTPAGAAVAQDANPAITVPADVVSGTAAAFDATVSTVPQVNAPADVATATGDAGAAAAAIQVLADVVVGIGSALDATVSASGSASAPAQNAAAVAVSFDASATIAAPADSVTASGSAFDATALVGALPGLADSTATVAATTIAAQANAEAVAALAIVYMTGPPDCNTARPALGTTARPSTGTTSRPSTGTTNPPCGP